MKPKYEAGITLVALIVTIIVLLILAAITINLTIGQRGILTRVGQAEQNYQYAERKENEEIQKMNNMISQVEKGSMLELPKLGTIVRTEENIEYIADGIGNVIPVPKGFAPIMTQEQGNKDTGFVIKDISVDNEGNPTKTNGNEYVWVPCTQNVANGNIKYDRYLFGSQVAGEIDEETKSIKIGENSNGTVYRTEAIPIIQENKTEVDSIKIYGGFYIGRYEVGIVEYDANIVTNNSSDLENWTGYTNGNAVVQKGKQVWNYITRNKAKEVAEKMYANSESVISRLCSSYAWDTTLKFIEMKYPNYTKNSEQGNYLDTTFMYIDLNGVTQTKNKEDSELVPTGQTIAVNNIYDMGGNALEWTTEGNSRASIPYITRGGGYGENANSGYVGIRYAGNTTHAVTEVSFRQTLFIK